VENNRIKPKKASEVVLGMVHALRNPKVDLRDMSVFGINTTKIKDFCIGCAATDFFLHNGFEKSELNKGGIRPNLFDTKTEFCYWESLELMIDALRRGDLSLLYDMFQYPQNLEIPLPRLGNYYTEEELKDYEKFGKSLEEAGY
jgi:hypothetical protein